MTGAAVPAADVGEMGVGYGVPAGQWRCLGGAGWCRGAFGAERRGRGQRRRSGDDVARRVCDARRARSGVHGARLGVSGRHVPGRYGARFDRGWCPFDAGECGAPARHGWARWRGPGVEMA
jgi:hypothetical protein